MSTDDAGSDPDGQPPMLFQAALECAHSVMQRAHEDSMALLAALERCVSQRGGAPD